MYEQKLNRIHPCGKGKMFYNTSVGYYIQIFENEELCERCDGHGRLFSKESPTVQRCKKCGGHGKVNWLQKVFN